MKQTHNLAVKKYSTVNFKKLWTENIHPSVRPSITEGIHWIQKIFTTLHFFQILLCYGLISN